MATASTEPEGRIFKKDNHDGRELTRVVFSVDDEVAAKYDGFTEVAGSAKAGGRASGSSANAANNAG